jgi:hypothetical protein
MFRRRAPSQKEVERRPETGGYGFPGLVSRAIARRKGWGYNPNTPMHWDAVWRTIARIEKRKVENGRTG